MRITRTITIAAPPDKVFSVVSDPGTHTIWRPSAVEFRTLDEAPLSPESELVEVVRFLGREYRTTYAVLQLERPRALTLASRDGPIPVLLRVALEPERAGTRASFTFDTLRPRVLGVPVPLFGSVMGWYLGDEANRLKRLVESLP